MTDTSLIFSILAIDKATDKILSVKGAFGALAAGAAVGVAAFAAKSVKMAADFESSQLRLVTTAGESEKNLKMVSAGVLDLSSKVGVSAAEMSRAMYTVESAGYHGADGLKVLEAASKGARIEGADVKEVADAVSSALNDYHLPASKAVEVTNTLIAAVGHGKTTMGELSAAMPNVMSAASAAGVSFQEASAALATMTMHGTDASTAGTYLRQVILGLENPSNKARGVMRSLGLDANEVSMNLGKNGLASTIAMVQDAIQNHLSPAGLVAVNALKKSSGSVTDFQAALANLPQGQKTAIGALADMVGGVKNLQGFLQLGGENLKVFEANTAAVRKQVAAGGKDVDGWAQFQKTLNAQWSEAKATVEALTIRLGTALIPAARGVASVTKDVATATMDAFSWFGKHKGITEALVVTIGSLVAITRVHAAVMAVEAAGGLVKYIAQMNIVQALTKTWTAVQWLLNVAMDANPIGLIIIGVAALAAGIWYLWTHSKGFRDFFIGMWHDIEAPAKAVGAWFAGPFAHFFVDAWDLIKKGAELWWHTFTGFWSGVINFFVKLPGEVGHALSALPGLIEAGLHRMVYLTSFFITSSIKFWLELPGKIWTVVTQLWDGVTSLVSRGIDATIAFFVALPGRAEAEAKRLWQLVTDNFSRGVDVSVAWVQQLPGRVEHWFVDTYNRVTKWAANAVDGVISWFEQLPGRAWSAMQDMARSIWNAVTGADRWLYNTGRDIITGLINGVKGAWDWAVGEVKHFMGDILQGAKDAIASKSPSRKFADEVGKWIPHGIAAGIAAHAYVAHDAMADLMGGMVMDAKVNATTSFGTTGEPGYPSSAGYPGRAGGGDIYITVNAGVGTDGQEVGERIAEVLRPVIRGRYGGNVQVALGGAR